VSVYKLVQNPTTITTPVMAVYGNPATEWQVTNLSQISGSGANYGIFLASGGTVVNGSTAATGALIGRESDEYGVKLLGNPSTVTNFGVIAGRYDIWMTGGGVVTNGASQALGASIDGGVDGVYIKGGTGTVTNLGTIKGAGRDGVELVAGGTVVSGGSHAQGALIAAESLGVYIKGAAGAITNFGTISARYPVFMNHGGTVTNGKPAAAGAAMLGSVDGVEITGASGSVTNAGSITGASRFGVEMYAGGSVVSDATGALISGSTEGVLIEGGAGTVNNLGAISGRYAVFFDKGGSVVNGGKAAQKATISGQLDGVEIELGSGAVTNSGTIISSSGVAVRLLAGGTVVNGAKNAQIDGLKSGVYIEEGQGTVTNLGTVSGTYAVFLVDGGRLTNGAKTATAAAILGASYGLDVELGFTTVTNLGTIRGQTKEGISLREGGIVVNGGAGATKATIAGLGDGISLASGTVTNFGTITGANGTAVQFGGSGNLLVVEPGAVFRGAGSSLGVVNGGAGSRLELAGTAPAVFSGLRTQFINFSTVKIDPGARWTVEVTPTQLSGEAIFGNGGPQPLELTAPGTFALGKVSGFQKIEVKNSGPNLISVFDSTFKNVAKHLITIEGGRGADTVAANLVSGLGLVLNGEAGDDTFRLSPTTLSFSKVSGGKGNDTLDLTGSGTIVVTGVTGVEAINLASVAGNTLTLTSANFAEVNGRTITIDGGNRGNTISAAGIAAADRVIIVGGAGIDALTGGPGGDIFEFSAAHLGKFDTVIGGGGADELLMTSAGTVQASGVSGVETYVLADGGTNRLTLVTANFAGLAQPTITVEGGDSGNTLSEAGVAASDTAMLIGGAGADTLIAGQHAVLTGGNGADLFVFTTPGSAASPDNNTITDFGAGADRMAFSNQGFKLGLAGASTTPKPLPPGLFTANATGSFGTAAERFAYDTTNGKLYFDAEGNMPGSTRLLVATLTGHPNLGAGQVFFVT
jgi:hypothetical protein